VAGIKFSLFADFADYPTKYIDNSNTLNTKRQSKKPEQQGLTA
jgi:hypothetical protein